MWDRGESRKKEIEKEREREYGCGDRVRIELNTQANRVERVRCEEKKNVVNEYVLKKIKTSGKATIMCKQVQRAPHKWIKKSATESATAVPRRLHVSVPSETCYHCCVQRASR